ncbi:MULTISPECIES: SMI1/KNR4 family protein [Bacillus cereus group]|uniref:SMI1/KNR4 family protein n=1 Tax=Bacillus cereus group TaxID=86661 RepID=UPI001F56F7CC|nr:MULTISPECIES: SMI1/KNR4 family protein [Bacillus cereus group]MDH2889800.1 SMI1/KNR4 family protein [Bacillus cytotoxicus]
MVKIESSHKKLSIEEIEKFEIENGVKLTEKYKKFLLQWNGGYPERSIFNISDELGKSVLNVFNGIGDMYDNLEKVIDIYEFRLAKGFIPIADDSAGNVICLGTEESYYEKIYFWDHEKEPEDPDDMSNMYFLANDIDEFLDNLYEDDDE